MKLSKLNFLQWITEKHKQKLEEKAQEKRAKFYKQKEQLVEGLVNPNSEQKYQLDPIRQGEMAKLRAKYLSDLVQKNNLDLNDAGRSKN